VSFAALAALLLAAAPVPTAATGSGIPLPEPGQGFLLADLDGDGRDDPVVLFGDESGCHLARVWFDAGELRIETVRLDPPRVFAPRLADADGDGKADLLSTDATGLLLRRGLGNGRFAEPPVRIAQGDDLLLPEEGCFPAYPYLMDVMGDPKAELVLPVLGGVRVLPLQGEAAAGAAMELTVEPRISSRPSSLSMASALPELLTGSSARVLLLGPVRNPAGFRLELAWWTRSPTDGSLTPHRSSFALPAGQRMVRLHRLDLEGDGRPEIAVLTAPRRMKQFLGEYGLHLYRGTDRAERASPPFYSAETKLNYWQLPTITHRPTTGGADLLLAFYRGLRTARLNVEVFRSDGAGSFEGKARDYSVEDRKNADRGFLKWFDANGDGTEDLAAATDDTLLVYRGLPGRDHPVSRTPAWTAPIEPRGLGTTLGVSGSGEWTIDVLGGVETVFHDLDGDGLTEVLHIDNGPPHPAGEDEAAERAIPRMIVETLRPPRP
jgi:hypothetical protein